jgi:hypothetical protein
MHRGGRRGWGLGPRPRVSGPCARIRPVARRTRSTRRTHPNKLPSPHTTASAARAAHAAIKPPRREAESRLNLNGPSESTGDGAGNPVPGPARDLNGLAWVVLILLALCTFTASVFLALLCLCSRLIRHGGREGKLRQQSHRHPAVCGPNGESAKRRSVLTLHQGSRNARLNPPSASEWGQGC